MCRCDAWGIARSAGHLRCGPPISKETSSGQASFLFRAGFFGPYLSPTVDASPWRRPPSPPLPLPFARISVTPIASALSGRSRPCLAHLFPLMPPATFPSRSNPVTGSRCAPRSTIVCGDPKHSLWPDRRCRAAVHTDGHHSPPWSMGPLAGSPRIAVLCGETGVVGRHPQ
jgi:hypothetical protein